ncbi:MAG: hypothetical protein KatS3mg044_1454 [Rhodothermaceae bacterium]|nr:MAG: hypothetical protein KatS3mg044_1454 [Rhodothermaceae bacterium]
MIALLVAGCGMASETEVRLEDPEPLPLASAPGSMAPWLTTASDGTVYLSWIEPDGDGHALRFATYAPGATGWSTPTTIALGTRWFVNWADTPSLTVDPEGTLTAHWLAYNGEGRYAYGVRVSRSTDGGQTWSTPVWLHDDDSPTEHGFVALVPEASERVRALWLDGRLFARGKKQMTLRSRSIERDGVLTPEVVVDSLVCDCCPVQAVGLPGGAVLAVYRNRTREEIRDIWRVRFDGTRWEAPAPVHEDGWQIAGCPVNGPAVAARGDRVVVAWFTAAGGEPHVRVAFSGDAGRTFAEPLNLDLGQPTGRVDAVMLDDGSALVTWIEATGEGEAAGIYARQVGSDRRMGAPHLLVASTTSRAGGYPRLVRSGSELVLAWTEPGEASFVRTARIRIET